MHNFESVCKILKEKGVPFERVEFLDTAISARTATSVKSGSYDPKNAIKTLIIRSPKGFIAVILKGDSRVDNQKLKTLIGGKWFVATKEELKQFGFEPGGVCPLLLEIPILIDKEVLNLDTWSMGAGAIDKGINVNKEECLKIFSSFQVDKFSS